MSNQIVIDLAEYYNEKYVELAGEESPDGESQTFQDIKPFIKPDELAMMIAIKRRYPDLINASLDELLDWKLALIGSDEI